MALLNPPSYIQGRTDHTAQQDRLMLASLVANEGVVDAGSLAVTAQTTPNMSVRVAAGKAFIKGDYNTYQGVYHCINDGSVNVSIGAANATNPRKDRIVARVLDASFSGAVNEWQIAAIPGTPAVSPTLPALPSTAIDLAYVTVNAGVTSISNANIQNARPLASSALASAPVTITSQTRPLNPITSMIAWESNTKRFVYYDGTNWQYMDVTPTTPIIDWWDNVDGRVLSSVTYTETTQNIYVPITTWVTGELVARAYGGGEITMKIIVDGTTRVMLDAKTDPTAWEVHSTNQHFPITAGNHSISVTSVASGNVVCMLMDGGSSRAARIFI